MTFALPSARPLAVFTALAVVVAGLSLAPTVAAEAASTTSQASSAVSKINSARSSVGKVKLKTANDLNEFVTDVAGLLAEAKSTKEEDLDVGKLTFIPAIDGEFWFHQYRVTGSSKSVPANLLKKIKADSDRTDKTGLYGSFSHAAVGLKKRGDYTYASVFLAKYTKKLQDSSDPKISGTRALGKTLKVSFPGWSIGNGERHYVWVADGVQLSSDKPLKLTADHVGKRISVQVFAFRDGYVEVTRKSNQTAKIAAGKLTTATPSVSGSRVVGSTLTAKTGKWTSGVEFRYQWKRNGSAIAGATASTYVLTPDDRAKKITISVKGVKAGYTAVTKSSTTKVATLGVFSAPAPTISSTGSNVGAVLTATVGTWSPKASAYRFQWFRDGVAISKATSKTYKAVEADLTKRISVRVSGSKSGYKSLSVTSEGYLFGAP